MSATTTRAELSAYNHIQDKPLSPLIAELLHEHGGRWQGTAQDLVEAIHLNLTPRSLSVKLDQSVSELERHGVAVTHKKIRGRKVLVFTATRDHAAIATKPPTLTQSIREEGVANIDDCEGVISFPFSWAY
ncbi:MAG: hypothetical protein JJE19_05640, partial [Methanosarcinales archaeon]|nr:hypothetical protein [Methanosarcinales archaeon]